MRRPALVALAWLVAGCGGSPTEPDPRTGPAKGLVLGSAVSAGHLDDRPYAALLRRRVNALTFENEAKWDNVHPGRRRFDFSGADRIARFARRHGMEVRGHVLVWHSQNPAWLERLRPTRREALALMREHIETVVRHLDRRFPGLVRQWDVVNEAIANDGARRRSLWQRWIGDDYLDHAFRFARRAAGPEVLLFYNDFVDDGAVQGAGAADGLKATPSGIRAGEACARAPKCRAVQRLVRGLVARGVPIDGVGFQAHLGSPDPSDYRAATRWVGRLGLRWAVTELDAAVPTGSRSDRRRQALGYERAASGCLADPACDTLVTWGLSDRYTWWRALSGGALPDALPFDDELRAKPAARALDRVVERARPRCVRGPTVTVVPPPRIGAAVVEVAGGRRVPAQGPPRIRLRPGAPQTIVRVTGRAAGGRARLVRVFRPCRR